MDELTVQLSQLMAQRKMLSFNFCCHKQNNVMNTQRLLTHVRLIEQASGEQTSNSCLVSAKNTEQIMAYLPTASNEDKDEIVLVLSLKLLVEPNLQSCLLPALLKSEYPWMRVIALDVARLLGNNLTFALDFTEVNYAKFLFAQSTEENESLLPPVLFYLYYRKTLNSYLCNFFPEYKNLLVRTPLDKKPATNKLSTLSWLYIDVLSDNNVPVQVLTQQFIQHDYLNSPLFDLYVTSLNEFDVTQLINQLSADETLTPYVIHAMALSGYAKFIPFLAQYLQQNAFALNAYKALRLLLGDELDNIIPLNVQLNSDDDERVYDLTYYGAKILNAWQQRLPLLTLAFNQESNENGNRLLNGTELTMANVDKALALGSQWHRYVAMLYKQQFCVEPYIHHAHALEVC